MSRATESIHLDAASCSCLSNTTIFFDRRNNSQHIFLIAVCRLNVISFYNSDFRLNIGLVNQSRRREDLRVIRVRQDTPEFLVDLASEAESEIEGCRERREASPEGSRASRELLDFPEIKVS